MASCAAGNATPLLMASRRGAFFREDQPMPIHRTATDHWVMVHISMEFDGALLRRWSASADGDWS